MNSSDLIHETIAAIMGNKVRSGLTILGIVIGIASVVAMLAIGQGASNSIQASIQALGSNLLTVRPGAQRTPGSPVSGGNGSSHSLLLTDADAISKLSGVKASSPELNENSQVVAAGSNTNTSIIGAVPAYADVHDVTMDQGSFISAANESSFSKVAVLGPTTRDDLFGVGADAVGKTIRIAGINFTVIGVTVSKGGSGFLNTDDRVYIPLSVGQHYISGATYVSDVSVQAASADVMTSVQNEITDLLMSRHRITDPTKADFSVQNQADIASSASSITGTLTYLLAAIAGISLIVGGIGIMNMMLTTVTERTREIGLRKAVGAKAVDISNQFLVESVMLTFGGGAIGVALGWLIAFAVTETGLLTASVSLFSVVLSFGVSAAIGIGFGYYPAKRASNLNPIQALKYE